MSRFLNFFRLFAGEIHFYNSQEREQLGHKVGLECLGHHYLLGPIVLTIFTRTNNRRLHKSRIAD